MDKQADGKRVVSVKLLEFPVDDAFLSRVASLGTLRKLYLPGTKVGGEA